MEPKNRGMAEGGETDELSQDRLWFLEGMDRVNQAIQDTDDLQQTAHVLDAMLSIFDCDRAWITYPCDPESKTWRTVADCARPTLAHSVPVSLDVTVDAAMADMHRLVSASEGPVCFGTENSEAISARPGVRSQICVAIHPKMDKPYMLGLEQCTCARNWTQQEQRLFKAIGQRIATLLTSLLLSRELQENKARLEEAQRVAHVGYWEWDLETNVVVWSAETYRIFGLKPEERPMDFATVRGMVHPEDREALYSGVDVEIDAGVHPIAEFRIVTPNGEVRTVHAITSKLWSALPGDPDDGESLRARKLFGTVQDITELKRAEEARHALSQDLQESKAWLEEAQRVAHLGYWVWDLETNQVIWSEETYRIFGLAPRAGSFDIGKVSEMIHPSDRESVFRTAEEAIRTGTRADSEHRLIRPDGEMRVVHSLGDLKKTSEGRTQMFGTTQDITDRKHVEEERQTLSSALHQSNARLEEAQRVAHIGHYEFNPVENHVTWSAELCRIWGLPPAKGPIDMTVVFEKIHPEDREYAARVVEETIRNGTRLKAEHRIIRPDGEVRFVQVLGTVKRDASGTAYELFGTCQDITERKLAEQALRRSQFYLSEGERLAHMGSWASRDLGIRWSDDLDIYWSDEVYKIFGLDPKSGTPNLQQFLAEIHPQDRASMAETMKRMHEQRCSCDATHRIIRPDGELRYVRCVGVPVFEDGVFQGFHGTTIDVTAHELLTQELRREQAYFAEAQGLAHIGSWATNYRTGQIHHISDETFRLHGFDPREGPIPLERFYDTIHPEDRPGVTAAIEDAIRTGADFDLREYRICRSDGTIRFLRAIGHRNPSEEIGYYIGITADITDRKRGEEERERLRRLEADLAHINRVNMMGELAAALAHEIKQPIAASITSANACLRWLAHDPPDLERARAAAARIDREGNRAADIINSLRAFYKTGTPGERQVVDVKGTIEEMRVLLQTEAARHGVTIHTELESDIPNILADRVQLQQVLMNLMLNGIEAMRDCGGALTVRSEVNSEGQLAVSIGDTGVGLPGESAELIFDPFHTTKPHGTGMGLTITRSIVESYGGKVWFTANQGPGATFHFTLPCGAEAHA
ncbi:MAG TPA: PAS domain-containing protein [Bryobacteraceae bacterium]|jgi:PAS domain S-box-containing protein|nr:PAS domain-containing protein [Bryobacteraceae bacterium]